MQPEEKIKIADILRKVARYTLLFITIPVFVFALLSGAETQGGGFTGLIKNSPNALPWLLLLLMIYIAWKRELAGGLIIVIFGLGTLYFFSINGQNFYLITFILNLLIVVLGIFFILSWYLRSKQP